MSAEGSSPDRAGSLVAACALARRGGLAVFPLQPGTKLPYAGSRGHLDASSDPEEVAARWPEPDANVGVGTGPVSDVWVLDVDPRHGGDRTLDRLLEQHEPLPSTLVSRTPSGGLHYWWRWVAGIDLRNSASRIGPGLDVRGDGGYVVVPPSQLADGRAYSWMVKAPIARAPDWLTALVASEPDRRFAEPIMGAIEEGGRNVALTSLAGTVRDRGCEADEILALLLAANAHRCDPPLPERDVQRIVRSVMRYPPGQAWWAVGEAEDAAIEAWMLEP